MTAPIADDELLGLLAVALVPAPVRPTMAEHELLRQALATQSEAAEHQDPPRRVIPFGRLPHPVAAAIVVTALTTGGAAAAVETNSLPGPLRSIASDVGIPMTSPALQQVDNDLNALRAALQLGDANAIKTDAATLSRDVDTLEPDDRITVDGEVNLLLDQAGGWLAAHPSHAGNDDRGSGNTATGHVEGGGTGDHRGAETSGASQDTSHATKGEGDSSSGPGGTGSGSDTTDGEGSGGGESVGGSGTSTNGGSPASGGDEGGGSGGPGAGAGGAGGETSGGGSSGGPGSTSSSGGSPATSGGGGGLQPESGSTPGGAAPSSGTGSGRGGGGGGGVDGGGARG